MDPKHPRNPVIDGSSRDPTQSYPPTVVRVDGTFYCITKTEATDLVGFESQDGVCWKEKVAHVLKTSNDGWDQAKVTSPLLRYDPRTSTYHLYYAGHLPDGEVAVGYATSDDPLSGYYKGPENPIYRPATLAEDLEGDFDLDSVHLSDVIVDGGIRFYGSARSRSGNSILWTATGDAWTTIDEPEILLESDEVPSGPVLQRPTILSIDGTYIMQFTAGEDAEILDERRLYLAVGETPTDFELVREPLLRPGPEGAWDDRRVYGAEWLTCQDGRYLEPEVVGDAVRLYFSGHDLGHHEATRWKQWLLKSSIGAYGRVEKDAAWKVMGRIFMTCSVERKTASVPEF